MKLSELKTGEKGIIVKVLGHGGFRKRIIEMGFIKGQEVEVLLNAPLQDPVKYKLMGYEVSLRHQEADHIEVVSTDTPIEATHFAFTEEAHTHEDDYIRHEAMKERRTINVALVGNPNCGKTSLFNYASGAHGHVGNYSGVTVDATEAHASMFGYDFNLTDLPGTYSLSCYSPEELYVREHLTEKMPDVVINVIDASNLERNLYLTTQLVDMNIRMVCALNMYDEFERRGDQVNLDTLSRLFGIPMIPTSFKNGTGVKELFKAVIQVYEGTSKASRHLHINYGHEIEDGIAHIQKYLKADEHITQHYSTRYLAIKLLEHDSQVLDYLGKHMAGENRMKDFHNLTNSRDKASTRVKEETGDDSETAIMDAKYGFIRGALKEAEFKTGTKEDTYKTTHRIDKVLSHKYFGFPIFFLLLYVMFETTFSLGQYPMDWIEEGVAWLGDKISATMPDGPLKAMLVDGVIGGVGSVIVFLPQILILYFFISLMEDSGYMARAAFIMDKLMHKMGLHGKSFIPLIMGFGCNVPAVMATRTIESPNHRESQVEDYHHDDPAVYELFGTPTYLYYDCRYVLLTAIPFVGAAVALRHRHPDVGHHQQAILLAGHQGRGYAFRDAIWRHTWEKGKEYLKKMGGIILVASCIVWALGYFPHNESLSREEQQEQSYIGRMGKTIEPIFSPQGFNWKLDVSLIAGIGAKEIVASTIGVLYSGDDSFGDDEEFSDDNEKYTHLRQVMLQEGITPLIAYAYLIFILLYFPCIATIAAIKNETGSWRWAGFAAIYTTIVAWIASAVVFQIGRIFIG